MRPRLAVVTGIDPHVTRRFLLAQPSVIDATVWYKRGRLHAEIAVSDTRTTNVAALQRLCDNALGSLQVPKEITLVCVSPHGGASATPRSVQLYEAA